MGRDRLTKIHNNHSQSFGSSESLRASLIQLFQLLIWNALRKHNWKRSSLYCIHNLQLWFDFRSVCIGNSRLDLTMLKIYRSWVSANILADLNSMMLIKKYYKVPINSTNTFVGSFNIMFYETKHCDFLGFIRCDVFTFSFKHQLHFDNFQTSDNRIMKKRVVFTSWQKYLIQPTLVVCIHHVQLNPVIGNKEITLT